MKGLKCFASICFLVLFASFAYSQDSPNLTGPTIQTTTCVDRGKVCPEWLHKLVGQYPPLTYAEVQHFKQDHFFSLGDGHRTLHPDKKSWALFLGLHAAEWTVLSYDIVSTHQARENWASEAPAIGFLTGMDLLLFKTVNPAMSLASPIVSIIHYGKDAAK